MDLNSLALKNFKTFHRRVYIHAVDEINNTELLISEVLRHDEITFVHLYLQMKDGALYVGMKTTIHLTAPSTHELEELRITR